MCGHGVASIGLADQLSFSQKDTTCRAVGAAKAETCGAVVSAIVLGIRNEDGRPCEAEGH